MFEFFFFFSSRRRHTRWTGDWSSDVCSSDLGDQAGAGAGRAARDARGTDPRGRAPAAACRGERAVRALISVYDKSGVAEFARGLVELGAEIVASGGTAAHLEEHGIEVTRIEGITGFAEL